MPQVQDAGLEEGQAVQARQVGFEQHLAEARRLFDQADESPTNPEELLRLEQGFREVLQRRQDDQVAEALRPLFDDRADEPPANPEELLRLEQGFREVLQRRQDDQAVSSFFSDPGMPAGPGDHNSIVTDAFAAAGSGHAGVEAAAPPVLAASQQQIRPSPDALDQGNHLPPQGGIINNEHSTAPLRPAKRQRAVDRPQAVAIQQQLSEIGNSGGRVPIQPPTQQLGELPLQGVPVQGTGSEHIGRLHAGAAPSARSEAPPAAIEDSINVSFAVPKDFSHGTQRVPDAMLPFLDRPGPLPDAGQARQAGFEQHVAEPRRADPVASGARASRYHHLSDEHRDLIDRAIAHSQEKYSETTARKYTFALSRLANDLSARGQAIDLRNHKSLVDHVGAFFPKDVDMKSALKALRAYHEPGYSATAGGPAASYPHLSAEHRDVIDKAIDRAAAQQNQSADTLRIYSNALRRLANDLGARGQATDLKNHQSLVDHLDTFFPNDQNIKTALNVLRAYHDPGNAATGWWPAAVPSKADARILEKLSSDSGLALSTRVVYGRLLRRFSEELESRGQTISGLDHNSRTELAEALFPGNKKLRFALQRVHNAEVPEALRPLFDNRADKPPTNPEELLRLEQGFREVLQQRQGDQAASSLFGNPGMPAGPEDPNRSVSDAFASSGHAGVEAAAPPVLAASQQQIRPWPDAFDQGNHLPPERVIINNEHDTALLRPAERQRALNTPQAAAIQQPLSEIGNSGGRVPMQPPTQQLGELPLEGVPVQRTGSEHIGRLHAEAAPSARAEAPPAAIENSINVSFAVPKGFSHGTQRVPDAMLSFLDRPGPLPDAGQARQAGFEQHVAEPRRAEPVASGARATGYRHLSDEHRDLIDKAIAHAAAQQKYSESTVLKYRYALRRLANDLGARGQATDLKNHQSLVDHLDAFFPKNDDMKRALNVLRAYHEPGYSATVGAPANRYPHLSDEHRDVIDKAIAHAEAQQHHSAPTLRIYSNALRRLANDLGARGQATDLKNHQSLVDHLNTFFPKDTDIRDIRPALNVLRAYHEPGYSATGRWPVTVPSKADAHVLEQVTSDSSLAPSTRVVYGHSLRRFSEALDRRGRTISGLDHDSRIEFAEVLFPGNDYLRWALERVRDAKPASDRIVADALAAAGSGHAGVEAAAPPVLAASQQQIRPWPDALDQGNLLPPERFIINNEHSTAPLRPAERQRALNTPQAAAIQQQPSEIGNSGGRMPMQPPMWQLGELPLQGVPVQGTGSEHIGRLHAGAAPSARSEAPPAAIEDSINVSFAVPKGFSHVTQRVPEAMLSSLYHYGLLPDADKPEWNYEIKGHGYTARRPEEGNDVWLLHRGAIREAGAAAVPARAPGPALPATARLSDTHLGVPLVDLTTSSDAHIEALPSGSSNLPRGAVLGATQLLGDEHIQRDYEFLEQQLQQADPALAARTRLVDPSVSHLLRHMEQQDARGTLQSIYNRNAGPSDFLFVPVNDGVGIDRGTHWSLLLVDRRDPERAVAYHYDSIQQNEQRYNDAPARKLATRLDATLVTPDMAQQKNAVDCGVFVVDGTRELVRRLANEERPDQQLPLHLNYLVADRQALQNRLREGRLPHELAASPAEALAAPGSQVQHAALQEQQARQVAPAPLERHLGKTREAEDKLTSTLDRSNRVNSGGVVINTERYTAPLRPAKRQRTDNSQSLAIGRQPSEANTTSIGQASDQARADLMASSRSRERSDAGR
ncbi:Ulp1 family isopeptidase [Mesorhizobium japonicum]|uniref:Ulp1 family isopeptidase n=1 Tax=Mesorhizobium japonicum TaxID=2066070 RepID=UPI0012FF1BDB